MEPIDFIFPLHPDSIITIFNELEDWNRTGVLPIGSITRGIINDYMIEVDMDNFFAASLSFQMAFYRFLATKYINQKVL